MSKSRDEGFVEFKRTGLRDEPEPCDDCRSCTGGVGKALWPLLAIASRTLTLMTTPRGQPPDVVGLSVRCPRCRHDAFWHSGAL